jgi:hypothetical protein
MDGGRCFRDLAREEGASTTISTNVTISYLPGVIKIMSTDEALHRHSCAQDEMTSIEVRRDVESKSKATPGKVVNPSFANSLPHPPCVAQLVPEIASSPSSLP